MKEIRDKIKKINESRDRESYGLLLRDKCDYRNCIYCNKSIYYYDSILRMSKDDNIYPDKKSYLTFKKINDKNYYLSVCEECLTKKYPEYQDKNKSRVFNMINEITAYAFNIPDEEWKKWKDKNYNRTLNNYIEKYGENEGQKKWEKYKDKQSFSNSFKYKKDKYGWTKEQFNEYNKSRAVTLENLIKKHGEEDGIKLWDSYIEKQKLTKSKEYVIEKYGLDYWNNLNEKKSQSLKSYCNRHGKELGKIKYINKFNNINIYPSSNSSQKFFNNLDLFLDKYDTFYQDKNEEYCLFLEDIGFIFLDYYIKDLNLCIEYYGDLWHANPKKYKEDDVVPMLETKAKSIWEKDNIRIRELKKQYNIDTIVVWENDINIEDIKKEIEKYEI